MGIENSIDTGLDFYGVENTEEKSHEITGITDEVTSYASLDIKYPCIVFKKDTKIAHHKLNVIVNMIKGSVDGSIGLYFRQGNDLLGIGEISPYQVMALYDLICGSENAEELDSRVEVYYNDGSPLLGSKKYVLCS